MGRKTQPTQQSAQPER